MRNVLAVWLIALSAALALALAAATIEGSWHGSGTASHRGNADAVKCAAKFTKAGAKSFAVSSQCSTDSGHYDILGQMTASGGSRYSGWVQANDAER